MKKAFVGLSSPLGYSYRKDFESTYGKPNPILDSPLGIFLFYDEIWFANRRTCPLNCENLPYVKFLDEEYDLSKLDLEQFHWSNSVIEKQLKSIGYMSFDTWGEAIELNLRDKKNYIDNHGRNFDFGKIKPTPNPTPINLMIDDFISEQLGFELITNSVTNNYVLNTVKNLENSDLRILTQNIICENIPNFQLENGPYHELIEDLRSDNLVKKFRSQMESSLSISKGKTLAQIKSELEEQMNTYLYELILKKIDTSNIHKGIISAVGGQVPILSNVYSALEGGAMVYNNIKDRKEVGWMGFIAKAKLKMK